MSFKVKTHMTRSIHSSIHSLIYFWITRKGKTGGAINLSSRDFSIKDKLSNKRYYFFFLLGGGG